MTRLLLRVLRTADDSNLAVGDLLHVPTDVAVLGRGEQADVLLPDPTVSRVHARLTVLPDGVRVERLAEHNGVFVDELPVEGDLVVRDDQAAVQLGAVVLLMMRVDSGANRTTLPVGSVHVVPEPSARIRVVWDAQQCTVYVDGRALDVTPRAAAFLGALCETPDAPVQEDDLRERMHGYTGNIHQCATLARSALRRRVEEGTLELADLVTSVRAAFDASFDDTDPNTVVRLLVGNQHSFGYVARVGALGVTVEQL